MSSPGARASDAFATAVTVLVTPGPAVAIATPSFPVSSAGVRHMRRGALVSRVDDANADVRYVIPNRLDVSTLKPEDIIHAPRFQASGDPCGDAGLAPVEVLALLIGDRCGIHCGSPLDASVASMRASGAKPGCQQVVQRPVLYLAGRIAWHFVFAQEYDLAGPFVAGKAFSCPGKQFGLADLRSRVPHHGRQNALPPFRVRASHDRGLTNRRMARQH